jgi:hypothetical protein
MALFYTVSPDFTKHIFTPCEASWIFFPLCLKKGEFPVKRGGAALALSGRRDALKRKKRLLRRRQPVEKVFSAGCCRFSELQKVLKI